ncbi:MAG: COX15/CtaA family protein [Pseudomonadales bacterium]
MAKQRFTRLALFAVALTAVVVILGAFTRLVDAGLGCPDWPGCYGFLTVPVNEAARVTAEARFPDTPVEVAKAWWEMVHRYFAGALGLLIAALAVVAIGNARRRSAGVEAAPQAAPLPLGLPIALVMLVICQAAFGAWTVTLKLWPQVVTAHLLGGFATLSLLWLLCLRLGVMERLRAPRSLLSHASVALAVVVLQIALGGWVSSNYAALACHDFPTCHGDWWPHMDMAGGFNVAQSVGPNYLGGQMESDARVAIQFVHRLGAGVVLLVVGALAWRLRRHGSPLALPLATVLGAQLLLGVLNVVLVLPLWSATAHNAVGALLLLAVVTVNYRAFRDERVLSRDLPIAGAARA